MKKSLIGLNAYNSKTKINNANWENSIKEETYLNNGDTVSLKASFIDSRNRVTGNINLDQDTTVELSYMFYYINRGGTPNKSLNPTTLFPNRQQTAMEYYNNGTEQPAVGATDAPQPSKPAGTTGIDVPVTATDGTDKTTANLAPLVESIYHCYSDDSIAKWFNPTDFPLVNFSDIIVGQSYQINSLGSISNEVWIEAGSPNPPVVGDIFQCIASPGNEAKYPIINVSSGTIGKTYKIISLGSGSDTDWNSINSALDPPVTAGTIFDYDTQYSAPTITDPTQFIVGSGYTVTTAIGYDFSSVGGPALPTNTNTPIDLNTQTQQGVFYQITQLTPSLTDGTSLIDYTPYFTTAPTIGFQFISPENGQNVANIAIPTDKNGIYAINTGMSIQVTTQGLINWDALGYNSNVPTTNDIDIVDAVANTNYVVIKTGGSYGLNNQFPIIELPNFIIGQIINLPAPTLIQNEDGSLTINASAGTQGVIYEVVNIGIIVNKTLPNVTDTAWISAGYTDVPPVVGGKFTYGQYFPESLEEAFESTATYDDTLITDTQDNLVTYQGQLIIVNNIGTMPLSDWVLLDPTLTAIPPVGYVFNLPVASTINTTNNGITTTIINEIPTLSVNDMVFQLLTPYTQFNTGVTFTIEANNTGIDWTHYGASDNNAGTTFTITNVPTSDDFKTTAIATAPVNSDIRITPTGTIIADEPSAYTPPVNSLPVIDPINLTSDYNGEYFVIINNNDIDPALWATMFVSTFGTGTPDDWDDGMIIQAQGITSTPMPNWTAGVQIQWLSFMGIPVGSTITIGADADTNLKEIWNAMGFTDNYTFTTIAQYPVTNFYAGTFVEGLAVGSFSFTTTGSVLRPYTLQVPFTFTTTGTYPTNLNSTDTTWVANLIPTDEIVEIQNYTFPFTFIATAVGTVNPIPYASFSSYILPTGTIQEDYEEGDLYLYDKVKLNRIRANNPVGFSNTIDPQSPDGLPYLLNYCIPKNVDGSTTFDPELLEATSIKPFIKKWKMTLKRGTYTPDYMAEVLSRGMSIQRQKIQTTSSGQNRYLGTPIQGINSQMYGASDFSYIRNQVTTATTEEGQINASQVGPYYGFIPPNNEQGAFPSKNQFPPDFTNLIPDDPLPIGIDSKQIDPARQFQPNQIGNKYQPNLAFNPKNKNILPGYDGNKTTLPDTLPVNPKYTALDFNNPDSQIQDDNPFIYRPNAFTQRNSLHPSEAKVRLTYNDYNLSNYNGINPFGDVADENIKNIEMFYKPLCSDMNSSYFVKTQYDNDLPISTDYAIKPVISVPVAQLPVLDLNPAVPSGNLNVGVAYSAPIEISSPLVGSPLMSIVYNQENSGLFEFPYMHTPVYAKLDATSDQIEECVGMYPTTINGSVNNTASGGILFYYGADSVFNVSPPGSVNGLPYIENGKIGWVEQLSTITSTSIYGYAIDDLEIFFKDLVFIYDETKPRTEYVFKNTSFYLLFQPYGTGFSIPVGQHLVVKGSLLNGVDGTNDLVIEVVANDGNGTITEFTYTGTPSDAYYSAVKQSMTQLNSVVQIAQQSGIIFYDMSATKADGTSTPFWENLGFDVKNMTYKGDTPLTYEKFTSLTTRGFLGTSNIFDPDTVASGTTEQSYLPYTDSLNMLGWYKLSTPGTSYALSSEDDLTYWIAKYFPDLYDIFDQLAPDGPPNPFDPNDSSKLPLETMPSVQAVGNFELQKKILYSVVEGTVPISAKTGFSDITDAGHFLISIEGYGGTYLLTDLDKLNVKSLVSSYYTGPNAFVSNSLADSALYEHLGSPMKIQNFKVRILSAYTGEEVENLGPNSSIYLEITKNLNKNNITNITSSN